MSRLSVNGMILLLGFCIGVANAEPLRIGGSGTGLAAIAHLAQEFAHRSGMELQVLPSIGTGGAVKALRMNDIDLGLGSRALQANEVGNRIRGLQYAETALVFAVSADQPVDGITRQQLLQIFNGELVEWSAGQPIRPIMRPRRESDTLALLAALPEMRAGLEHARSRQSVVAFTDQEAADMLEQIPGSIGTSTLSLIMAEQRRLKALRLDGIAPTPANLASGAYPLVKPLYFLTDSNPPPAVNRLIEFILSDGRDYLLRTGHRLVD